MDHHKIQHQILGTAASEASSLSAGCDRSTMSPLMYFSYEAREVAVAAHRGETRAESRGVQFMVLSSLICKVEI